VELRAQGAPITNRLLDRLPAKERAHVLAGCEQVQLTFAEILAAPGDTIENVFFPTHSFISLLGPIGATHVLEVALAGNEGVYGVPLALGVDVSPVHALVQGGGSAWRMAAADFRRELQSVPRLKECIDGYVHVLMSQLIQTAGCTRFHVVEQRVARWLLMTADRSHSRSFHITHEFLAHMLGVRRVGITVAATSLQKRKLISYTRGAVTILNRKGLEGASCTCYRSDIASYDTVFG
jgi:hypothetical protein